MRNRLLVAVILAAHHVGSLVRGPNTEYDYAIRAHCRRRIELCRMFGVLAGIRVTGRTAAIYISAAFGCMHVLAAAMNLRVVFVVCTVAILYPTFNATSATRLYRPIQFDRQTPKIN